VQYPGILQKSSEELDPIDSFAHWPVLLSIF